MQRLKDFDKIHFERDLELGRENVKCLRYMSTWCKNANIQKVSEGLYAQMTGLPIATHRVKCRYVQTESESMNLKMLFSSFILEHCINCTHHIQNGDVSWGQKIIDDYKKQQEIREQEMENEKKRLISLRAELIEKLDIIKNKVDPESYKILEFFKELFSEKEVARKHAATKIKQSASLAPDLFPDESIEYIINLVGSKDYCNQIIPICIELVKKRSDLNARLYKMALDNLEKGLEVELNASLILTLGQNVNYPLDSKYIKRLLLSQNHYNPFGMRKETDDYTNSITVLIKCFDVNPESVQSIISQELKSENDIIRIQICGAVELIQNERPQIAINIMDSIVKSLMLNDNKEYGQTPSGEISEIVQKAFSYSPNQVDQILSNTMSHVRPAVQEDIVRIYRNQFFRRSWQERKKRKSSNISESENVSIQRLIIWMKDEKLELDIRGQVLEALSIASSEATMGVLPSFDSLLGFYAIISGQKDPPKTSPRILIPGHDEKPQLEQIDQLLRKQQWDTIKLNLQKCLEELCDVKPSDTFSCVSECLNHPLETLDEDFKACCVSLMGKIGNNYEFRSQALPIIWRALMDYDSAWTRSVAINAIVDMFNGVSSLPPENLLDVLILHLHDQMVVVHRAALRAISWHPNWFNEGQSIEILYWLSILLKVYKNKPYQLKDICEGIMSIGHRYEKLKIASINMVESIFPVGEELVDKDIIENLMRYYKADDELTAPLVAKDIALYLSNYDRDHYNSYLDRFYMFEWLLKISDTTFNCVKDYIFNSAKELAKRDIFETLYFASVFSQFKAFYYENIVLDIGVNSLIEEPRNEELRKKVKKISLFAGGNAALQKGEVDKANDFLIMEEEVDI